MKTGLLLGLVFLLLVGVLGASKQSPGHSCFWGAALHGYPITAGKLAKVEQEMGFPPQIVLFYLQWPPPGGAGEFPQESLEAIWKHGAVPCLSWEPMYSQNNGEVTVLFQQITEGRYDAYLSMFARKAAAWGKPFIIRFAHEMNLERYHWGTVKGRYGPGSPEIYQQMFRYVVNLFRKAGAHKVLWAFCVNAESLPNPAHNPSASWNRARNYYPGDDYVDILGMDGYNWGTTQTPKKNGWQSSWRSFQDIFAPMYQELRGLSPHKPLLVFETASAREGGDKALWLKEAISVLRSWQVQGLVWFQVNKEVDWRLNRGGDFSSLIPKRSHGSTAQQWLKSMIRQ